MSGRILVSAFGSGGDLLPLIPFAERLRDRGHDVRFAITPFLSLLLRTYRFPVYRIGGGRELRFFDDPDVVSTRFDGWASWKLTTERYVAPCVRDDVDTLDDVVQRWRPDVLVTGTFSVAARIAGARHGIPRIDVSIYPQHVPRLLSAPGYAGALRAAVGSLVGEDPRSERVGDLAWGAGAGRLLLHDPAVLPDRLVGDGTAVGFPYRDHGVPVGDEVDKVRSWIAAGGRPVVLATLGSFLGVTQQLAWASILRAARALAARVVLVGPGAPRVEDMADYDPGTCTTAGFVPLAQLMPDADVTVHHGGIGTMFTQLRSERPALVVPQGYDQPFNARMIEHLGVGLDGTAWGVTAGLKELLANAGYADRSRQLASQLITAADATDRAAAAVLAAMT
ncbi:MAG: glycosyltransferase [Acidimicrobiales bacterium]